ncbi:PAN domain-containing protein [Aliiroseovarius subalbicans]|uniref:PAN domain-containing protein n=1 Tax=Aliiroseovarius subalbicans TaxID=2925840 RepID=UPI001F568383|nr:PAN domain-containing protein [Aliiroseovarius subalbicans]MCI2398891.1 PAN domain-containing protein [Aliiroseovarius subalbicans]
MTHTPISKRASALITGLLAGMLSLPAFGPALADYTRQCNAELLVAPQNASQTYVTYDFTVRKTVDLYAQVNQARREARSRIIQCLTDHFDEAEVEGRPRACMNLESVEVVNYPFTTLHADLTDALCAANPDEDSLLVRADLYLTGNEGCVASGSREHVEITQNYPIDCTTPIGDGGMDEAVEDEPTIGDAGDWECVGEGCDGTTEEDPEPEEDTSPATATYVPLPSVRLPGNDLYLLELDAPNWMLCRQACTEDTRCGAWTYRKPNDRSGPICLLKSRAGIPIPDGCCRSGIKR